MDVAAMTYFKLVNLLTHDLVTPPLLTIAEEHSGMPGLCAPVVQLGIGFDYRLAMGPPPVWERICSILSTKVGTASDCTRMVDVDVIELATELCKKRSEERRIAYTENHDGSLVGGQSLAFRLMGSDMYEHMSILTAATEVVLRGMAMHKMSRLLAYSLGGEAYLNFMGNEFGHPDWVDFPRSGNGHSLMMARRRWDLADDPLLRYNQLMAFDAAMHSAQAKHPWLHARAPSSIGAIGGCHCDNYAQLIWFVRATALFAFNFHPERWGSVLCGLLRLSPPSAPQLQPQLQQPAVVLNSDHSRFGGKGQRVEIMMGDRYMGKKEVGGREVRSYPRSSSSSHSQVMISVSVPPLTACMVLLPSHLRQLALAERG